MIKRMRIEPISTYLERYRKGGVAHPVTVANGFVYLSGLPPFDPESGEIKHNRSSVSVNWCWSSSSIAWKPQAHRFRK
jgi:enamine deaminase RidA (YjgF/YER057c/UK114 family)